MTKPALATVHDVNAGAGQSPDQTRALRQRIANLEAAVQRLNDRLSNYETLFSANPIPAFIYRVDNLDIVDSNSSASALYGHSRETFCRLNLLDLFSRDSKLHFDLWPLAFVSNPIPLARLPTIAPTSVCYW